MMLRRFAGHFEGPASVGGDDHPLTRGFDLACFSRPAGNAGMISGALEVEKLWKKGLQWFKMRHLSDRYS
jgi:hypothetical protein